MEGLDEILMESSQITAEMLTQLQTYASDYFDKERKDGWNSWEDNVSLVSFDYLGNYLLQNKYEDHDSQLILVYQVTANIEDKIDDKMTNKEYTYFWTINYHDLEITSDGNLVAESPYDLSLELPDSKTNFKFDPDRYRSEYSFVGYGSLESMFDDLVEGQSFDYVYEENMG